MSLLEKSGVQAGGAGHVSPSKVICIGKREQSTARMVRFCMYGELGKEKDPTRQVEGESWVSCHPGLHRKKKYPVAAYSTLLSLNPACKPIVMRHLLLPRHCCPTGTHPISVPPHHLPRALPELPRGSSRRDLSPRELGCFEFFFFGEKKQTKTKTKEHCLKIETEVTDL